MDVNDVRGIVWGELGTVVSVNRTCPKCKDITVMVRLGSSNPAKQNQFRCLRCLSVFEETVAVSFNEMPNPAAGNK